MTDVTTYLSPNGVNQTQGAGPATKIAIATLEGVATLGRGGPSAPWRMVGRSLSDRHVGSLVYEPGSGKLFAGAHADGGAWVSDDGAGAAWRELTDGLDRPHRSLGEGGRGVAGEDPARRFAVGLADRSLRRAECLDAKPGVFGEHRHETLTHGAGGTENRDG